MSAASQQSFSTTWGLRALRLLAFIAAALSLGCSTTIVPPVSPVDPVAVFLLDHGDTSSVVLPTSDDRMTQYVYGDWNWYALGNTGIVDGLLALFWPTQGTLGRRELPGPARADKIREQVRAQVITHLYAIPVGRADVERLLARLDAEHRAGQRIAHVAAHDLEFVPHPRRYTYFHNSNHAVAGWLQDLGCEVQGLAFHSSWRVERGERHE